MNQMLMPRIQGSYEFDKDKGKHWWFIEVTMQDQHVATIDSRKAKEGIVAWYDTAKEAKIALESEVKNVVKLLNKKVAGEKSGDYVDFKNNKVVRDKEIIVPKGRKDTRVHLVEELFKLSRNELRDFIIMEAQAGEYHDYKNDKYPCGKMAVVGYLEQLGAKELKAKVMDGEFDELADEEDKNMMKKDLGVGPNKHGANKMAEVLGLS